MSEEKSLQESLNELTGKAADEMMEVAEATNSYGKIGGKLSSEEAANVVANPPEPQAEPESQPPAEPQREQSFLEKKYGEGNWTEADKGYLELQKTLTAEREAREQERQQYLQYFQSLQQPQQSAAPDPFKQLEDVGIPGDALGAAIDAKAAAKVQEVLAPLLNEAQAEALLMQREDYDAKVGQDAVSWVQAEPTLAPRFNAALAEARSPESRALVKEWALEQYGKAHGKQVENAIRANEQTRNAIVEESRKDAGIVGAKNAPARTPAKTDDRFIEADELERMKKLASLGYGQAAAGKLLGPSLPDDMFN
jgi:hypothetical protein